MTSFEQNNLEPPHRSPWHVVTGAIVLIFGSAGGVYFLGWLLMV